MTVVGFATTFEMILLGEPATKVAVVLTDAPPTVAVIVFASALVEASVATNVPDASVLPLAGDKSLLLPVLLSTTLSPANGFPSVSRTTNVTVVVLNPSATTTLGFATS